MITNDLLDDVDDPTERLNTRLMGDTILSHTHTHPHTRTQERLLIQNTFKLSFGMTSLQSVKHNK